MPPKASKPAAKEAPKAKQQPKPQPKGAAKQGGGAAAKDAGKQEKAAKQQPQQQGKQQAAAPKAGGKKAAAAKQQPAKQQPQAKQQPKAKAAAVSKPKPKPAAAAPKRTYPGVYVKNLDFDGMSHQTVADAFRQSCGKVHQVRLRHGKYCLVFFDNPAAQKKALELNGRTMKGKKIVVEQAKKAKAEPDRATYCKTVYVGQLPGGVTGKQIRAHFKPCGPITCVRLYAKHYGFVYFKDVPSAKKAVGMAQKTFFGRQLTIKLSVRTREMDKRKHKATKARLQRLKLIQAFRRRQMKAMGIKQKAAAAARRSSSKK